ncbi:hypothetical protein M9H77_35878 [Catharanthus roseus]|uniref:Uncharacterized protein n=1 Tax=Catharanthus roseus TaxID=4058 RepID=A0ACB9ZR05_CATRO|nr:hypothetical protein M9H77_35878 [Catharanthus roseus]
MLLIYKPLQRCIMILIPGERLIQPKVQYERLPTFCYFCGRIGHRYTQCEAKTAANSNLETFPYKPNLGSTERGNPITVYKENLSSVASFAVTTIHHLSSIPEADKAACLPRHSGLHLFQNIPPVHPLHHSTNLPVNLINGGKSPVVSVHTDKVSGNGQPPPVITVSIKKSS